MTDFRALCVELADALDHNRQCLMDDRSLTHPLAQPEPEVVGPTDEELDALWFEIDGRQGLGWKSFARAVLARWGHQPAPAAEGEVEELVAWLHGQDGGIGRRAIYSRIADLLEQRHPAPVPVAERLPGPEDCDAEGRCWWGFEETDDYEASWTLRKMIGLPFDDTHWLPATALPLPQGEVQP